MTTTPRTAPTVIVQEHIYFDAWFSVLLDGRGYWCRDDGKGLQFAPEADEFRKVYTVRVVCGAGAGCTCPDATFRKRLCKHALASREIIAQTW